MIEPVIGWCKETGGLSRTRFVGHERIQNDGLLVHLNDIHSMTGFLRNHKAHLERLSATGRPEVLTINGKARVVIQDAAAYQRLLDALEELDTTRILRERLKSLQSGEPGVPAEQVLAEVRNTLGIKPQ